MKFKKFKMLDYLLRKRNPINSRYKKIRLDKNERISSFDNYFLNKIKKNLNSEYISAYPEVEEIYKVLSKTLSLSANMFVITSGSDLAIKNCFELFISPRDEVITLNPTYGMVDVYSKLFQAKQIKIDFDKDLHLDISKIYKKISKKTNLVILANPNSPTGTVINKKEIIKILNLGKKYGFYVLIDECYYGYYPNSYVSYIKRFNNLIISRSFSKIGLAGCRIGYLVASKRIAKLLYKFRPFYEISSFSCMVLKEFLKNNKYFKDYIRETLIGKEYLMSGLKKLKINFYRTNTNFILIKFKSEKIKKEIKDLFAKRNILVLGEGKLIEGKKILRVTLGPKEFMHKVLKIFESYKIANKFL